MATPWDVDTAVYEDKYKSVGAQNTAPRGIFFKPDGTKMYVVGAASVRYVYQYSLSTVWDISTATYESKYKDVSSEDTGPWGLFFRADGLKMYFVGSTNQRVYQYSLSTPWGVDTASYEDKYKNITQDDAPYYVFFKSDGTRMYVVGAINDTVFQYTLSTPWNVDTASYDNKSKALYNEDGSPQDIFFKPDGSKMYSVGLVNDRVYQYSLSTPWVIDTASYEDKYKSVGSEDGTPRGLFFKADGYEMYVVGDTNNTVYQYTLPPLPEFEYVGTGTFAYSGTAITIIGFTYVGTGSLTYSGSGICRYEVPDWEYAGSGTYNFSGVGLYSLGLFCVGIGEFVYLGSAAQVHACYYLYAGSGVLSYLGDAVYRYQFFWTKVPKETGDWTLVSKEEGDWTRVEKERDG